MRPAACASSWPLGWLVFLVAGLDRPALVSARGRLEDRVADLVNKGLSGYDLVDKLDMWYGQDTPQIIGPSKVLDAIGNKDGRVTLDDWSMAKLPKEHFEYFDKDANGLLNKDEVYYWFMQRKFARTMNLSEVHNPPKGHLKRIGSWKEPLPTEGLVYHKPYPHPREFWKRHMDGYLPAVLKGAQHGWPCMNWTKEELTKRFGWVDAKLEPKVEGRNNNTAYSELDKLSKHHRLNISEYLRLEQGKNVYVVSIIPQVMAWEVAHPATLLCGSRSVIVDRRSKPPYKLGKHEYPHESGHDWMTHVFEANLWAGTGRTRSQFHYDKEWNVNCLLSGSKRWFFLNSFDHEKDIQWARGRKFKAANPLNNAWTDWVYLEPDSVDLIVQHKLRTADYYELIQEAGDCIFIPYAMLHQVEKLDDDFQVAVSWMFLPETVYDERSCSKAPLEEDLPLAAMDTLYMYTGKGIIPQGYNDPLNFVNEIKGNMQERNVKHLSLKLFTALVTRGDAILGKVKDKKTRIKKIYELINSYAKDPAKGLTVDELLKIPLRLWCKPAAEGDQEGALPCDNGEEYHFCDDGEFKKMEDAVQAHLARSASAQKKQEKPPKGGRPGEPAPPRVWTPRAASPRRKSRKTDREEL